MSFIYDDKTLIDTLIKSAIDFENKFQKNAQVSAEPGYKSLLGKFVTNLLNQYKSGPTIGDMRINDMVSPGNLFTFIAKNQLKTSDGQRPVYFGTEKVPESSGTWIPVDEEMVMISMESVDEKGQRKQIQAPFYVNVELLSKYMNELLGKTNEQDNEQQKKLIHEMLGGIIDKLNKQLGTKISKEPKKSEHQLPDTQVLENVPEKLSTNNLNETGNRPLTVRDLKSQGNFNTWLNSSGIKIIDNAGKESDFGQDFSKYRCSVLNILHLRAKNFADRADDKSKTHWNYYVSSVEQLAGQVSCPLSGSQGKGQAQPSGRVTQSTLQQMAMALPLDADDVDFNRIKYFFKLFTQLASADNTDKFAEINNMMAQAGTVMDECTRLSNGATRINLASDPREISNMLQQPSIRTYIPFLQKVEYAIELTARTVDALYAMYARPVRGQDTRPVFTEQQRELIEQQSKGSDSFAMRNKQSLQSLMRRQSEIMGLTQ